jgi:hypothetical protein
MRGHEHDYPADEHTSRTSSPADEAAERLRRLARETKEAEPERRLTKDGR